MIFSKLRNVCFYYLKLNYSLVLHLKETDMIMLYMLVCENNIY